MIKSRKPGSWVLLVVSMALVVAACAPAAETPPAEETTVATTEPPDEPEPETTTTVEETGISEERCEANRAAGRINFATGFFWAAAATIIDVVVAEDQGYFDELCLDVDIRPGITTDNQAQLVANEIQVTSLSGVGFTAQLIDQGVPVVAPFVEGRRSIWLLMTDEDITGLDDLTGRTVGLKGHFPPEVALMLEDAGVSVEDLQTVQVGFDPRLIDQPDLAAIPVYKSNEPFAIEESAIGVNYFDPVEFDIPGTFAVLVFRSDFASTRPTAVEDFLRATSRAFLWAAENPEEAVEYLAARAEAGAQDYNRELEVFRWKTERDLVLADVSADSPLGVPLYDLIDQEIQIFIDAGLLEEAPDATSLFPDQFARAIYDEDGELIWPPQ